MASMKVLLAAACVAVGFLCSMTDAQSLRAGSQALKKEELLNVDGLDISSLLKLLGLLGVDTSRDGLDLNSLLPVVLDKSKNVGFDPLSLFSDPVVSIKNSILDLTGNSNEAKTSTSTTAPAGTAGTCPGNIKVKFGTSASQTAETEGKLVPSKKLVLLNPVLATMCANPSVPQCKWGYIFPNGVVSGVDGYRAEFAVMMYVELTKTWTLLRAHIAHPIIEYSGSIDTNKNSPAETTTFPWLTGPGAVFTNWQTVQGITCA